MEHDNSFPAYLDHYIKANHRKPNKDQKFLDGSITQDWRQESGDADDMDVRNPMLD